MGVSVPRSPRSPRQRRTRRAGARRKPSKKDLEEFERRIMMSLERSLGVSLGPIDALAASLRDAP